MAAKLNQDDKTIQLREAPSGSSNLCPGCVMWRGVDNCTLVRGFLEGDPHNKDHITRTTQCLRFVRR